MSEPSNEWQAWLNSLDARGRAAAESLRARFEALGAADAGDWAKSEICEDLPHLARFMLLRSLWRGPIGGWADPDAIDVGWLVMESAEDGAPTGRALSGLHEDLLAMDPSGRDGADLWQ
ncbi:hypothetical protein [Streptomyces misionensis]|uniref:hypothetical protein n=1 Tax=Streptomyces misionensis TaxID=67331 RepID=UPI003685898F